MTTYFVALELRHRDNVIRQLRGWGTVREFSHIPKLVEFEGTADDDARLQAIEGVRSVERADGEPFTLTGAIDLRQGLEGLTGQLPFVLHGSKPGARLFNTGRDLSRPGEIVRFNYDATAGGVGNGTGVNIYIVDTGVDPGHAEVAARFVSRVHDGFSSTPALHYHGTGCAIVAAGANFGIAPGASVYDCRVFPSTGTSATSSSIVNGMNSALAHYSGGTKPGILNCSFAARTTSDAYNTVLEACTDAGLLVVCAAGNEGQDLAGKFAGTQDYWPAENPDSFTVGGLDERMRVHRDSNFGGQTDIYGSYQGWTLGGEPNLTFSNGASRGTSFATPMVVGMMARVLTEAAKLADRAAVETFKAAFLASFGVEDVLDLNGFSFTGAKRLYVPGVTRAGVFSV